MIVKEVVLNLAFLVAMSVLSGFIDRRWRRNTRRGVIFQGVLFGLVAIVGMLFPFKLSEGLIFDGRSVVLGLCSLYFGPVTGLIAAVGPTILRVSMGGPGVYMGVSVILSSFLIGTLFFYLVRQKKIRLNTAILYVFGMVVHLVMVGLILLLPSGFRELTYKTLTFTILGVYPVAVVFIGKILGDQAENEALIKSLADNEEQFRTLVANMQQGLIVHQVIFSDKKEVADSRILYVNDQYEKITGEKRDNLLAMQGSQWFTGKGGSFTEAFQNVATSGIPGHFEWFFPLTSRYAECDVYRPSLGRFAVVLSDITEMKRNVEELTLAKEKAEAGDRMKTVFLHNISHEIRTPLNGILGFCNLLGSEEISADERVSYLSSLQTSTDRFIQTINNFVDISMISTGTLTINSRPTDLSALFRRTGERFRAICYSHKLDFFMDLSGLNSLSRFMVDPDLLEKVLCHLLDNAVKFTEKGQVAFIVSMVNDLLTISVKDTGEGIHTAAVDRIFESFQQEEIAEKRRHEGSGLGLSIANGIIRKMGGSIRVESEKGNGSNFIVTLAVSVKNEIPDLTGRNSMERTISENLSILIAEDDESNLFYLETILKKARISIHSVANGLEAVRMCRENPGIGLVLMDIRMPVMDGMEATREIKAFRKSLPIIAVTAFAMSGDERKAREAGCDDYLTKPLNKKQLFEKIGYYTGFNSNTIN